MFGLTAMTGAYAGGRLAQFIPGAVLLIAFAVLMIAAALAMLHGRKDTGVGDRRPPVVKIAVVGVGVGVVSGLVGAGGGFLLVPALSLLAGLPIPTAWAPRWSSSPRSPTPAWPAISPVETSTGGSRPW